MFFLTIYCFDIRVLTGAKNGNKYFYILYFSAVFVNDLEFFTGKVNKHLVPGLMRQAYLKRSLTAKPGNENKTGSSCIHQDAVGGTPAIKDIVLLRCV